jgi:hypothetical protein
MKKHVIFMTIAVVVFVLGMSVIAYCQEEIRIIDNLAIVALKSIKVTEGNPTYLEFAITIKNSNNRKLKMGSGEYTFYLGTDGVKGLDLGSEKGAPDKILEQGTETLVPFKVDMGSDSEQVRKKVIHILNCIGSPAEKKAFVTIEGKFKLGIYSEEKKGWSFVTSEVEWNFEPKIQSDVVLQ